MHGPPPLPQAGCCLEGFDAPSVEGAEAQGPTCMHALSGHRGRLSARGVDVSPSWHRRENHSGLFVGRTLFGHSPSSIVRAWQLPHQHKYPPDFSLG